MKDPIDRHAAIDAASRGCFELRGVFEIVKKEIEALPSAQQWIPTSERLPEEHSEVLVTTNNGTVIQCNFFGFIGIHFVWKSAEGNHTYWDKEVVAWMPLPKPYHEGNDEQ